MNNRASLDQLGLSAGKKAHLHRILFQHGLANGTALFLPYDQGLEHGPRDFRQPGRRRPPLYRPAGRRGWLQRHRHPDRPGLVKVNFPHPEKRTGVPDPYTTEFSSQDAVDAIVCAANRTLVLISGGAKAGDEAMLEKAVQSMQAGATGQLFGRNVWQLFGRNVWRRGHDESLHLVSQLRDILAKHPST